MCNSVRQTLGVQLWYQRLICMGCRRCLSVIRTCTNSRRVGSPNISPAEKRASAVREHARHDVISTRGPRDKRVPASSGITKPRLQKPPNKTKQQHFNFFLYVQRRCGKKCAFAVMRSSWIANFCLTTEASLELNGTAFSMALHWPAHISITLQRLPHGQAFMIRPRWGKKMQPKRWKY